VVTIKDVAAIAGVSPSTVSRILNGKSNAKQTLDKVNKAIERLKYKPNALAKGLKSKKTGILALVVPDIGYPLFPELAKGVEKAAESFGYEVSIFNTTESVKRERECLERLVRGWVDGVIFCQVSRQSDNFLLLANRNIPLVLIDRVIEGVPISVVLIDNVKAGYTATSHLVEFGHTKIGCISGPSHILSSNERVLGYKMSLREHNIQIDNSLIVTGNHRIRSGYDAMNILLNTHEEINAVFAGNDLMALGAIISIKERGLNIPDDIAIIGFDDIPLDNLIEPSLSTMAQPVERMSFEAVRILVNQIKDRNSAQERIVIEADLVIRHSTQPGFNNTSKGIDLVKELRSYY